MWEPFTESGKKVCVHAQEFAEALNNNYIGTEHLLLGVIENSEVTRAVCKLIKKDFSIDAVVEELLYIVGHDSKTTLKHEFTFTPRAKKSIELAFEAARKLKHNYISSEHMLLGLLSEGEGVAGRVLINLGFDLNDLKDRIVGAISDAPKKEEEKVSPTLFLNTLNKKGVMLTKCDETCNLLLEIGDLTHQAHEYIMAEEVVKLKKFLDENYGE